MLDVTFLAHSGFLVDDASAVMCLIIIRIQTILFAVGKTWRELWFFISHSHADHFNPSITEFDGPQTRYICHQDVPLEGKVKKCITCVLAKMRH